MLFHITVADRSASCADLGACKIPLSSHYTSEESAERVAIVWRTEKMKSTAELIEKGTARIALYANLWAPRAPLEKLAELRLALLEIYHAALREKLPWSGLIVELVRTNIKSAEEIVETVSAFPNLRDSMSLLKRDIEFLIELH